MTPTIYPIHVYGDPEKVLIGDIVWIRVRKERERNMFDKLFKNA